jgi:hypothetical protein
VLGVSFDEFEYANGADGSCQECGEPTDEPWHAYCPDCWRQQQGWTPPDRDALEQQHETRQHVSLLRVIERVDQLERQVAGLAELAASLASRLERLELDGPIRDRRGKA